jgi:hypothetical protein
LPSTIPGGPSTRDPAELCGGRRLDHPLMTYQETVPISPPRCRSTRSGLPGGGRRGGGGLHEHRAPDPLSSDGPHARERTLLRHGGRLVRVGAAVHRLAPARLVPRLRPLGYYRRWQAVRKSKSREVGKLESRNLTKSWVV